MKKLNLILGCLIIISTVTQAQYKSNKKKYDYRTFKREAGDPYNSTVAGIASFLIPGIGQMSAGEFGRGAAFFGGYAGSIIIFAIGSANYYEQDGIVHGGPGLQYLGLFSVLAVDILSVVDAVRVAKVNNLFFRDKTKTGYIFQISPYFGSADFEKIPLGLSMRIRF